MKLVVCVIVTGFISFFSMDIHAGELKTYTLMHKGLERTYHVYLPPDHSKTNPVPLVIALHGGGGTGLGMDRSTNGQITRGAGKRGWIVVFPEGIQKGWDDGRNVNRLKGRRRKKADDLGFISKLIDRLHGDFGIDLERVYATGISNGGFMSLRLAVELSERIAAVGVVTASLGKVMETKIPKKPVGVLFMNGTEDPLVPYNGGYVRLFGIKRGEILSTDDSIRWWVKHMECKDTPEKSKLPDRVESDGTYTEVEKYMDCLGHARVVLYRVVHGGHTWPGGKQYLPKKTIGRVSRDFWGAEKIFNFFALHHRQKD